MNWSAVKASVLTRFLDLSHSALGGADIAILANPTEELLDARKRGKQIRLYQQAGTAIAVVPRRTPRRLEENYLYSTRAFQAGALAAGDFRFFQSAVGNASLQDGFPAAVGALDDLETNMDTPGQIAQGKSFALKQVGVSFNSNISLANLATLMDSGSLRFSKQGDQFGLRHGPVRLWGGGTGIAGVTTATNVNGVHNGSADHRAVRTLRVPRVLKEKESFAYLYHVPRAVFAGDGVTALTIAAPGALMTLWLWGGQMDVIPG